MHMNCMENAHFDVPNTLGDELFILTGDSASMIQNKEILSMLCRFALKYS